MAVTITALDLAVELRASDGGAALVEPLASVFSRLLGAAMALVETYAALAPEAVQNEAAIRLAAWLYDHVPGRTFADAMGASGARSLLYPYRSRRVGILTDDGGAG